MINIAVARREIVVHMSTTALHLVYSLRHDLDPRLLLTVTAASSHKLVLSFSISLTLDLCCLDFVR